MIKVIMGLGNPGTRYDKTRHNLGFEIVDRLARRLEAAWNTAEARYDQAPNDKFGVRLVRPKTFVNLSGEAAADLTARHSILQSR